MNKVKTNQSNLNQFLLELANISGYFDIIGWAPRNVIDNTAWDIAGSVVIQALNVITHNVDNIVRQGNWPWISWEAAKDVVWQTVNHTIIEVKIKGGSHEQIMKACCILMIEKRKQIRENIFEKIEMALSKKWLIGLNQVDQIRYVKILLSFEGKDLENFKKMSVMQRCDYLFQMRRLIQLTDNFDLIKDHENLVEKSDIKEVYSKIFPVLPSVDLISQLPKVLSDVVVGYCEFCWIFNNDDISDEDEFYNRLLAV